MLALMNGLDGGESAPIHPARLAEWLALPRATVKRNLVRLLEDGFPVERTAQGWRATVADNDKLDRAVSLLLSERSWWGELMASSFPRVLPDAYLRYRLEMLLDKVLTSKAVSARITPDAVRAFVVVSDSVPPDALLRQELPKAIVEAVVSARDAQELHDRLQTLVGGKDAHIELPANLVDGCAPMLRLSPALLQTSLDPRPFGFGRARIEGLGADESSDDDLVPTLLATVCTLIYDADSILTPEPDGPSARDRPLPVRPRIEGRGSAGRLRTFARRLTRRPVASGPLVAEAALRGDEIRDLATRVPDLIASTEGLELLFRLRIELSSTSPASHRIVERMNRILRDVNETLELR